MAFASVWTETVSIPTYETGEPEKNPMFLDKRVYQGSSGKVYPYPTIEKISDIKTDKEYEAVFLENDYLKVMILPQLGGRIQRAYDKTNQYDFVYYNHVIKPALVGLTGPWISGGIEFNWPQHHRPTTFLPVDYVMKENEDGSKSVLVHDVDQMYGTKGIAAFTLYPGKAYIEITGQLYNRTATPQTFLWWANPAVPANEYTQSIFPPDVHAVMDHGKRDVSRFPIATGVYYKQDYSEGVDISRYKNIPVPTSYMAEKSKYDFVGAYDYKQEAGILHVADHHISPGKKQWTWGCGSFGKAWDRNLTDTDGPYIELMTGVYTDNQPDFTWLKPFEEKTFQQYFMPYKAVGQVKNATKDAALGLACDNGTITVTVYASAVFPDSVIRLEYEGSILFEETALISPVNIFKKSLHKEHIQEEKLLLRVSSGGKTLVSYQPEAKTIPKLPEPAKAALEPEKIMTNEELYLTGLHIEQYRHATYLPDPYYLEGLRRDPGDIRINQAYGALLLNRGLLKDSEAHFRKAIERLTWKNPNPYTSEAYYLLGLSLFCTDREKEAADAFYKAAWSNEQQEMSYYFLAAIAARQHDFESALEYVEKALIKNSHNIKARGLKAFVLRSLLQPKEALRYIEESLSIDPFDFVSEHEKVLITGQEKSAWNKKMRGFHENYLMAARDYAEFGAYQEAILILQECPAAHPMLQYYKAYYQFRLGEDPKEALLAAEGLKPDYCFPNKPEDIKVLSFALTHPFCTYAAYYLGNLYYDKKQWEKAIALWEAASKRLPDFPTVRRNLALAYYNKKKDPIGAREMLKTAWQLNPSDARIFLELDQLYKKLGVSFETRLKNFEEHKNIIKERDDLYIEYITLLNLTSRFKEAYSCIMSRKFHPWEGGEGKITAQYTLSLTELAKKEQMAQNWQKSKDLLRKALEYPENLGEGKLEGTKDNQIYYYLGIACDELGQHEKAHACFQKASMGTDEPAGAMFYNDQPADRILYQGLAKKKLGLIKEANARFYRLLDYGEQHLDDQVKIDYFAVSLPDFLIFDDDYTQKNRAHCYYLMGLAHIGLGSPAKAREFFKHALAAEPSHMMAYLYEKQIIKA